MADNFDLRKYLAEGRLTNNSKTLNESGPKIFTQEFGGYDDANFLKIAWKMSIEDLKALLEETLSNLKWIKNVGPKGKIMGTFTRRDIQLLNSRIKFLQEIIKSKTTNPEYIPDRYK